jgi:transposase
VSLKSAGFELVQYDQCLFTTSGSRYQSEASQSVVVCLWISEESGVIMMHAEEKKAFNGKDMARQFRRLREVMGQERMVAAFGDQASINRAKVVREACAEPDVDIKQWFNVTYRPDLLGIDYLFKAAKHQHRERITDLKKSGMPIDNLAVVQECLGSFSKDSV